MESQNESIKLASWERTGERTGSSRHDNKAQCDRRQSGSSVGIQGEAVARSRPVSLTEHLAVTSTGI
jgi:hypothetical protein